MLLPKKLIKFGIKQVYLHVWQRNFYEHIHQNQESLEAIRNYIINNPINWENDPENISQIYHDDTLLLDIPF
ncbi:hypothetical protein DSM107003_00130 [Trichormus variabilis SAG 1403-4b]|uniref:Transposase IS200-like domain-containing protein n=1 Tax=Trichormus variabilis SAG 1403-4b TaxID=447716 RepID=A0A433V001_ANAVA|nr:hypothetical protein DSM107003_00130 [Trichormus variabilis SAG 1403-4b]